MSGLAEKSSVLYQLTWTKAEWVWDVQHTEAFELLKKAVVELPVLTWSVYLGYWCIRCCNRSWVEPGSGGQGTNHCFHSISLNNAQWSYCTTRKELLTVVVFTCHSFHHYMLGRAFTMWTDHTSLVWLMCFKQIGGQLSRWLEDLSQYAYIIEHRSDKKYCNADGLSRIPEGTTCDCYISGRTWIVFLWRVYMLHEDAQTVEEIWVRCWWYTSVGDTSCAVRRIQPGGWGVFSCKLKASRMRPKGIQPIWWGSLFGCSMSRFLWDQRWFHQWQRIRPCSWLRFWVSRWASAAQWGVTSGSQQWGPVQIKFHGAVFQRWVPWTQLKDADLSPMIRWLETSQDPSQAELQLQSLATQHYWRFRD